VKLFSSLVVMGALSFFIAACGDEGNPSSPNADATVGNPTADGEIDNPIVEGPKVVSFADGNLEACVRKALGIAEGDLLDEQLLNLHALECQDANIASLEGLQLAKNLQFLSVWENKIESIEQLVGLESLTELQLGFNQISDITPLSNHLKLTRLGLSQNKIENLSPLKDLVQLRWLNLDNNKIADVQLDQLKGLSELSWLTLEHNGIEDSSAITPLQLEGTEVYKEFDVIDFTSDLHAHPRFGQRKADRENLRYQLGPQGELKLRYLEEGNSLPLMRQFGGHLEIDGGFIVLKQGGESTTVGRLVGKRPVLCSAEFSTTCEILLGRKVGRSIEMNTQPVISIKILLKDRLPGHTLEEAPAFGSVDKDLANFALASPNQLDAGTCLFMSNTGSMEILINQHVDPTTVKYGGDTDLSERYLMNVSDLVSKETLRYSITDTIYSFNEAGGALLSRDYPFTCGYVKENASGVRVPADPSEEGAYFSAATNWFNELPTGWQDSLIQTPPVERTTIFIDPKKNKNSVWNVGLMNDDIVERIKYELRTKNAPVIVVYNHYLYWHANIVVGYDDNEASGGCPMVESSMEYFNEKNAGAYTEKIQAHIDTLGGCSDHGVFYVRDSIYDGGNDEPEHQYTANYSQKYSKRIVKLSYNWPRFLGNHSYTIHRK
jgi:hypothetical protein